jgi:hypothetical protein
MACVCHGGHRMPLLRISVLFVDVSTQELTICYHTKTICHEDASIFFLCKRDLH